VNVILADFVYPMAILFDAKIRREQTCISETHTATGSLDGSATGLWIIMELEFMKYGVIGYLIHTGNGFMRFAATVFSTSAENGCMKLGGIGFLTETGNGWDRTIEEERKVTNHERFDRHMEILLLGWRCDTLHFSR
jgi:hypothetical protein